MASFIEVNESRHFAALPNSKLEASRRDVQQLRIEQRDLAPRTVHDEYEANRESERVIAEAQRLSDAVAAQTAICERLEKRLRAEERVIASCKQFLHELPDSARLRVVEGRAGDLDDIRQRIKQVNDEMSRVRTFPVPADDLAERIGRYVADACRTRPARSSAASVMVKRCACCFR